VTWQGTHAWSLAEAGRLDEARDIVARHGLDRPDLFPVDDFALAAASYPAMLALLLGDAAMGAAAEAAMRPYEDQWITIDVFCIGPVIWPMAVAVGAQARYDEADELFERADAMLADFGLIPGRRMVLLYRAMALLRSPSAAHQERARQLIAQGIESAEAAGLGRLREKFEALLH
jgi:hypothetical protein